jgi:hypothetical protein
MHRHHASQRAAAIQAAYAILLHLYPKQSGTLTAQRKASLAALGSSEKAQWIYAGVAWGTDCCGRHLGMAADRWDRAATAAVSRRARHCRYHGCAGRLAADATGKRRARGVRSVTAVSLDHPMGTDAAIAVPFAATNGLGQPGF